MWVSDDDYCLNADRTKAVKASDPAAAFVLINKGGELDEAEAKKYGLIAFEVKADEAPVENKADAGPASKKSK
jgi:hypothetical protein